MSILLEIQCPHYILCTKLKSQCYQILSVLFCEPHCTTSCVMNVVQGVFIDQLRKQPRVTMLHFHRCSQGLFSAGISAGIRSFRAQGEDGPGHQMILGG